MHSHTQILSYSTQKRKCEKVTQKFRIYFLKQSLTAEYRLIYNRRVKTRLSGAQRRNFDFYSDYRHFHLLRRRRIDARFCDNVRDTDFQEVSFQKFQEKISHVFAVYYRHFSLRGVRCNTQLKFFLYFRRVRKHRLTRFFGRYGVHGLLRAVRAVRT